MGEYNTLHQIRKNYEEGKTVIFMTNLLGCKQNDNFSINFKDIEPLFVEKFDIETDPLWNLLLLYSSK